QAGRSLGEDVQDRCAVAGRIAVGAVALPWFATADAAGQVEGQERLAAARPALEPCDRVAVEQPVDDGLGRGELVELLAAEQLGRQLPVPGVRSGAAVATLAGRLTVPAGEVAAVLDHDHRPASPTASRSPTPRVMWVAAQLIGSAAVH